MSTAENQDAGRLAASGDRALAASGGALRSPSAKGRLTIQAGASEGTSCGHPPPRCAWRPLGIASRVAACATAVTAINQCWLRPSASSQQGALARGRLFVQRLSAYRTSDPMPFQNCSRCSALRNGLSRHKAARVVAALPTHFLFHDPLLRSAPRLHFFHGMGLTRRQAEKDKPCHEETQTIPAGSSSRQAV